MYPKVSGLNQNEITTTINTSWEATQRVMAAKLTRLTHKIWIQLHLVAESCIICSSCSRRPVRKIWIHPRAHQHFLFYKLISVKKSRYSSVGIATGYGLDDQCSGVRCPAGAEKFSLLHRVQTGSGARPTSYPMGTGVSFPGGKAAEAWSWPLTSF
jgi:hypothetical protein